MQKKFALIGWQIKNSASVFVHNHIFKHFNLHKNCSYQLAETSPDNFNKHFSNLKQFDGLNVTSPFKKLAFQKLKLNSSSANYFKCVNTIKKLKNGSLKGFCTDHIGLLKSLKNFHQLNFKNILIIGFGGAGQIAAQCLKNKCKNIFITVKPKHQIDHNTKTYIISNTKTKIQFVTNDNIPQINFDLVINATTCGNYNSKCQAPINLNNLNNVSSVFDLIYFPTKTILLKQAEKLGAKTMNGIEMLVYQAISAQQIWNNLKISNQFANILIKKTTQFLKTLEAIEMESINK